MLQNVHKRFEHFCFCSFVFPADVQLFRQPLRLNGGYGAANLFIQAEGCLAGYDFDAGPSPGPHRREMALPTPPCRCLLK